MVKGWKDLGPEAGSEQRGAPLPKPRPQEDEPPAGLDIRGCRGQAWPWLAGTPTPTPRALV